jgi:hypothetical protein
MLPSPRSTSPRHLCGAIEMGRRRSRGLIVASRSLVSRRQADLCHSLAGHGVHLEKSGGAQDRWNVSQAHTHTWHTGIRERKERANATLHKRGIFVATAVLTPDDSVYRVWRSLEAFAIAVGADTIVVHTLVGAPVVCHGRVHGTHLPTLPWHQSVAPPLPLCCWPFTRGHDCTVQGSGRGHKVQAENTHPEGKGRDIDHVLVHEHDLLKTATHQKCACTGTRARTRTERDCARERERESESARERMREKERKRNKEREVSGTGTREQRARKKKRMQRAIARGQRPGRHAPHSTLRTRANISEVQVFCFFVFRDNGSHGASSHSRWPLSCD